MMKVYYLGTCNTCQKIMESCHFPRDTIFQELKAAPITFSQLSQLHKLVGSYEPLFNRRSKQYRGLGLHEQSLTEEDYKRYLLQDYTFLKRPTVLFNDRVLIGNAKKTLIALQKILDSYSPYETTV